MAPSAAPSLAAAEAASFNHPFTPYAIQQDFMRSLYACLEDGAVGIFESPTGTGKSLSLICGALTWLRDHKRAKFLQATAVDDDETDEPAWMVEASRRERRQRILARRKLLEQRIARARAEEKRLAAKGEQRAAKRRKAGGDRAGQGEESEGDAEFLLDEYDSDTGTQGPIKDESTSEGGLSSATRSLLERLGGHSITTSADPPDLDADPDSDVRIFYTSRTHSQLSQFAHELRRVALPPSIPPDDDAPATPFTPCAPTPTEPVRHTPLASRAQLCIHLPVARQPTQTAVNERCLELQRPRTPAAKRCPHLAAARDPVQAADFRDRALTRVRDIEDLGELGRRVGVCPYYAARAVVPHSEIVTLPYPLLLQRSARAALGLSLRNHVVIVDEAHNLPDAVGALFGARISLAQLRRARGQLTAYARRYRNRLAGANRVYLAQVVRVVMGVLAFAERVAKQERGEVEGVCEPAEMLGQAADQINPHKLGRYLEESRLARKVDGFVEYVQRKAASGAPEGDEAAEVGGKTTMPVLFQVHAFLQALMNPSKEGRFFYEVTAAGGGDGRDVVLKYMLLDPAPHFREIVEEARAVILAGGTMSPMSDYRTQLFPYLDPERLRTFSFGHVVPRENLFARAVSRGLTGRPFEFTYDKRGSEEVITDLGHTILRLITAIPDGVVVFFPSYDYLSRVLSVWRSPTTSTPTTQPIYTLLSHHKPIFHESPSLPADTLLARYAAAVHARTGALLLAVMGGRLAEGINFADALGRAVLVVGLPYANVRSPAWRAKIAHVERGAREAAVRAGMGGAEAARRGREAGREFGENACLRVVGQCVGRAIRHAGDYAAVVLVDRRYDGARVRGKLPGWVAGALEGEGQGGEEVADGLRRFFEGKE